MKEKFYRNSDLKINKYFSLPQFKEQIIEAKKHGKDVFYNQVRILNNCYYARKLQGDISIKDIFKVYWNDFKDKFKHRLTRPHLIESIKTMIGCHDFDNGFLYYECTNCNNFYMDGFSCHSRFCSSCGQKYKKQRNEKISSKLLHASHRQFVFTIPEQLRPYFQKYHGLLNILFDSVNESLNLFLRSRSLKLFNNEKRKLGFIAFLHTFGRDLKWHPHIHLLLAERYINKDGKLCKFDFYCFNYIRKSFQYCLLNNVYNYFKNIIKDRELTHEIYLLNKSLLGFYKDGFYVYGPNFNNFNTTTSNMKTLINYITRYASHPPISKRRIISTNDDNHTITWFYDSHKDDDVKDEELKLGKQIITEDIFSFMSKLIIHIPDKKFQIIRYYGFYANRFINKLENNLLFSSAELKKMRDNTLWINGLLSSFGYNPTLCVCGNQMLVNYQLSSFKGVP